MGLAAQSALTIKLPLLPAAGVAAGPGLNNSTPGGDSVVAPGRFAAMLGAIAGVVVKPDAGRPARNAAASLIAPANSMDTAKTAVATPPPSIAVAPPDVPANTALPAASTAPSPAPDGAAKGAISAGKSAGKSAAAKSDAALKSVAPTDPAPPPPQVIFPAPIANIPAVAPVLQSGGGGRNSPVRNNDNSNSVAVAGARIQADLNPAKQASADAPPHSQVAANPAGFAHLINDNGTMHAAGVVAPLTAAPLTHQPGASARNISVTAAPLPPAHAPAAMQASAAMVRFISNADGKQTMNVQLAPEELGKLQISVTRGPEGTTAITVTAERSDTLALLVRDQASLQTSLDQAGVSSQGRTLSFGLSGQDLGGGGNGGGSSGFTGRGNAASQYYGDHSDGNSTPVVPVAVSQIGLVNITA